jgi:HAD superfamily hydrolase (TIGR01450 family)
MSAYLPGRGEVDTIVLDVDGVLLLGSQPIPGAGEALRELAAAGLKLVLATNNSMRSPGHAREEVKRVVGFDVGPNAAMNSGAATARYLSTRVERAFVVGSDGLRDTLRGSGIDITTDWSAADAVVTGIGLDVGYRDFAEAGLAVQNGAAFYATNMDASYPRPEGVYPGAGAIAGVIERTTGVSPEVCGKPHLPMRQALADLCGDYPLVVGDRPETDIALGKAEGWATVLVLTGVTASPADVPAEYEPDMALGSIAELPRALGIG